MVGNNIINNDQNNIADDIIKFKLDDEKNEVTSICQNFLELFYRYRKFWR